MVWIAAFGRTLCREDHPGKWCAEEHRRTQCPENHPGTHGWLRQEERSFKGHHARLWKPTQFVILKCSCSGSDLRSFRRTVLRPDEVGTGLCEAKTGFSISGLLVSAANVSKWSFSIDLNKERFLIMSTKTSLISQLFRLFSWFFRKQNFRFSFRRKNVFMFCFVLFCFVYI